MIKIGIIYKNGNDLLVADRVIDITGAYVLCFPIVMAESGDSVRGVKQAYYKQGKPFVLSFEELSQMEVLEIQCESCLFLDKRVSNGVCNCKCIQHAFFTPIRYAQFVPKCGLYRPVTMPFDKQPSEITNASLFLNDVLKGRTIDVFPSNDDGTCDAPAFGFLNGVLSSEQEFDEVFGSYVDKKVTIIENLWTYQLGCELNSFTINKRDFDYTFYLKECILGVNAYIFTESKKAVVFHEESVYVLPIPDSASIYTLHAEHCHIEEGRN